MTYSSSSAITLDTVATAGVSDTNNRVGVLLRLTPGMNFQVNMLFEASFNGTNWTPGITFFSNPCFAHPFPSNFQGGFYYNNSAPTLGTVTNQTVYLASTGLATAIGPLTFTIADDGDPNQVAFANIASSNQAVVANGSISVVNNGNGTGSISFTALPQTYGTQGTSTIAFNGVDGLGATSTTNSFTVLVDQPPILDTNTPLTVGQGASGAVTQSLLHATDPDTANPATFQMQGQPHAGTLYLNGTPNPASFSQADVNNGNVTYTNGNSCQTSDNFQFQVFDSNGGFANDPTQGAGPTTYSFGINVTLTQTAPTAVTPTPLQTGLGASVSSNVQATSSDCGPPVITYQFGAPTHGNLSNTNSSTGAFTYTPNLGFSGTDNFTFTGTTYGTLVSAPATVSINVVDQPPTAVPGNVVTHINTPTSGNLVATSPDLPPPTLTYAITTQPVHGQLSANTATGAFTYVPNSGYAGNDSFTFTASDGTLSSASATVTIQIRQYPKAGDLLVTNQTTPPTIVLFDPASSQQSILSDDLMLKRPYGIAVQGNGNVLIADGGPGGTSTGFMLGIDPASGTASSFGSVGLSAAPIGLALEASGNVLVGDTANGVIERLDGTTGAQIGSSISLGSGTVPTGIAVATDGTLWVNDAEVVVHGAGATNYLYHVNADGSSPTIITSGGSLNAPVGITLFGTTAYISTVGPLIGGGSTNIVSVDTTATPPVTQGLLTSDGNLMASPGIVVAPTNHLYVTSTGNASIVDVNPTNGAQTVLTQGGLLQSPFGLAIVPTPTTGVDLSVSMTAPNGYIKETHPVVYKITVQNLGPQDATTAMIHDFLPPNFSNETWICTTNGSGSCTASGAGSLNDTINVPVGAVLTYTVTVTASLPEQFTVYRVAVRPASGVTDVNLNNNNATNGLIEKIFANGFDP